MVTHGWFPRTNPDRNALTLERRFAMIRKRTSLIVFCLFALAGCATPAPIKEAVVDIDKGYAQNLTIMQQYRQLVVKFQERHRYWYLYVRQRLLLDLALRSTTQDYWRSKIEMVDGEEVGLTKEEYVDTTAKILGDDLRKVVNELRLRGLAAQKGSYKQGIMFEAGKPNNTTGKIVARLPEIVNLVTEKADKNYKGIVTGKTSHFDTYLTNVSALRQINATIKRYLDIDVTVAPEDLSEIANSIRQLQQ
jgi:hypothetical protein